jgi:ankyrin repeat protein
MAAIHATMARGGTIDERDTQLNTPLHHACLAGHLEAVELLLSYGAEVNAENALGKDCLQFAGHSGDTRIIMRLIENGADVLHRSKDGKTGAETRLSSARALTSSPIISVAFIDCQRLHRRVTHAN